MIGDPEVCNYGVWVGSVAEREKEIFHMFESSLSTLSSDKPITIPQQYIIHRKKIPEMSDKQYLITYVQKSKNEKHFLKL